MKSAPFTENRIAAAVHDELEEARSSEKPGALKIALGAAAGLLGGVASNAAYDGLKVLVEKIHAFISA